MKATKVWDIVQPRDQWERNFAHLDYLWTGLHIMLSGRRIKISYIDGQKLARDISFIEGFKI